MDAPAYQQPRFGYIQDYSSALLKLSSMIFIVFTDKRKSSTIGQVVDFQTHGIGPLLNPMLRVTSQASMSARVSVKKQDSHSHRHGSVILATLAP